MSRDNAPAAGAERPPRLLAAPNVMEGRDRAAIAAIARSFGDPAAAHVLDIHSDPDHGRSVFTLAARQGALADALVAGARAATDWIDLRSAAGRHPHVGALDVAPVVYLAGERRGAACAEALTVANRIGAELGVPVLLYGQLATDPARAERAQLRAGGPAGLAARLSAGELEADFGPSRAGPRSGATLVTARPPLVAFNVDLASDDVALARRIAAELRESGGSGLPRVRAIGLPLAERRCAQVSFNVEDPLAVPLAALIAAVARAAPIARAELVGLAPRAAFEDFPADVELLAAEPRTIEEAIASLEMTPARSQDAHESMPDAGCAPDPPSG